MNGRSVIKCNDNQWLSHEIHKSLVSEKRTLIVNQYIPNKKRRQKLVHKDDCKLGIWKHVLRVMCTSLCSQVISIVRGEIGTANWGRLYIVLTTMSLCWR